MWAPLPPIVEVIFGSKGNGEFDFPSMEVSLQDRRAEMLGLHYARFT